MATIALIGLGTTGSKTAKELAQVPNTTIITIDRDIVTLQNISHQLYTQNQIGMPKPLALAQNIPNTHPICDELNTSTTNHLANADIIIDCVDNMYTRRIIAHYAQLHNIPYLYSGASANQGAVAVFHTTTCSFADVFGSKDEGLSCDGHTIHNDVAQFIAHTIVAIVNTYIQTKKLPAVLYQYNKQPIQLPKNTNKPQTQLDSPHNIIKLCGKHLYQGWIPQDIAQSYTTTYTKINNTTIFANGRVLVHATSQQQAQEQLKHLHRVCPK